MLVQMRVAAEVVTTGLPAGAQVIERQVGIAVEQHPVRLFREQHSFNRLDHPPGVLAWVPPPMPRW